MDGSLGLNILILCFLLLWLLEGCDWDIIMIDLKWAMGLDLWRVFLGGGGDGLKDYLLALLESVVLVGEHVLVEVFVYYGEVFQLLGFQVALVYVTALVELGHVLDHCYQVILVLLYWLIFIKMQNILLIPILQFILILIHFIDETFENSVLLLSRWWSFEGYRFGTRWRRDIHIFLRIEYYCCSW